MFRRTRSYSHETRERARELRRAGLTYPEIIRELGGDIPQPTLQGWVKNIELTTEQRARIKQLELDGSARGRPFGALWNRLQKQKRLEAAKVEALPHAKRLSNDRQALQLMAAPLYIGEGSKGEDQFAFANSDPQVIRTWMSLLRRNFEIDEGKFRCRLTISVGMDEEGVKQFWSEITGVPTSQFTRSTVDRRVSKRPREGYRGVCAVHYFSLEVRRYLDALAQGVIDELLEDNFQQL
jgi:hypothetical protein